MNSSTHVVFLTAENDTLLNLARDLARLGFAIHMHRDPATLHQAFVLDACPLIFVGLAAAETNDAVMKVRALHPTAGILAYAEFADSEQRVRTMLCGADYCVEPSTSAVEIAALMRALTRRGADILASAEATTARSAASRDSTKPSMHGPSGASSLWRLANKGWTLVAPSGRALALTAGERDLVQRFFEAPDRKIRRELDIASHTPLDPGVSNAAIVSPRVIDVMISRLRRKASHKQMGLPIRAVPGWGYVFAGDIERVGVDQRDRAASDASQPNVSSDTAWSDERSTCSDCIDCASH